MESPGAAPDILKNRGPVGRVLYVDLDQEFPWFSPFRGELDRLGMADEPGGGDMEKAGRIPGFSRNRGQLDFVKDYLGSSLKHFQRLFPELRFTFSFTSFWKEIGSLGLKSFDALEVHAVLHGLHETGEGGHVFSSAHVAGGDTQPNAVLRLVGPGDRRPLDRHGSLGALVAPGPSRPGTGVAPTLV